MRQYWTRWRWPVLLAVVLMTALLTGPIALASAVPRTQQLQPIGADSLGQLSGDAFDQAFLTQMMMHHAMGVMMTQPVVVSGGHQELKELGAQMIGVQSSEIEQMRGWLQGWYGLTPTCPMTSSGTMMPGMTPGAMPGMQPGMMPGAMPGMQPGTMPGSPGQQPGPGPMRPGGMMPGPGMPMTPGGMPGMMPGGPAGTMPMPGMPMSGALSPDQLDAAFMTWMIAHHQGAIEMAALADERAAHQEVKDLAASIIASQSAEIETMRGWLADWYGR